MATILDQIVAHKRQEIAFARELIPQTQLEACCQNLPPTRDFSGALRQQGIRFITEVKKASPSAGVIRSDFDPVAIARIYEAHGADCLSVLTDEHFFQGKLEYLSLIRSQVKLPALRKDFILDHYQLLEARAAGADAILLIAETLPDPLLKNLYDSARSLGLHVLIEFHDPEQLPRVLATGCELVGINNRDLKTFKTSLHNTLGIRDKIPGDRIIVSESGISTPEDIELLAWHGVHAVLVGESLMRAENIGLSLDRLRGGIRVG